MKLPGGGRLPVWEVVKRLYREMRADAVTDTAAQLAYYLLFSIFPFLFFCAALAAYLPIESTIELALARTRAILPPEAHKLIDEHLRGLLAEERPGVLSFALLASLWSASRGADAVRKALNLAYDVKESRPWWKTQALSVGMTLLGVVLVVIGIGSLVLGGQAGFWLSQRIGVGHQFVMVAGWLRWPATAVLIMTLAALAYYLLPDVKQKFTFITPGSVIGTVAWMIATWAFGFYASRFGSYNVTYGSIGGVMILVTWLYISGLVFIMGGELNAVLEHASEEGKAEGARAEGEAPPPKEDRPSVAPPGAVKSATAGT